ncbi:hypothetical protein F441_11139 [Phytophthora nicotianae CJ01A1]|uniref:PiggyBac transposable element-derived protein domain-containing protein n=1 Tax=Phytophthora nicotianae CJ01A1 TaxID=1317063 RepID=W2WTM2_PHYNI|nr:hypothetical protein F441_11139 [Phytophthora nicotianae CJ01A1]
MSNAHSAPAGPPEEAGRGTGVWEFLEDDSIALGVDNVEDYLLRKARIEADVVLGRLRRRMFGVASAEPRRVGIGVVLLLWLDESVLTAIKNIVNLSFNSNSFVTSQELLRFIEMELWLSFYATSPSLFYSSNNNDEYPPAQTAMPQARYMAILNALSKTQHAGNTDGQRVAPLTFDRDLVHVEDLVRRLCAEMGFVESETIASLDDDMIRLRSKAVDDIGLAHVRNPKKGYDKLITRDLSLTNVIFIALQAMAPCNTAYFQLPLVYLSMDTLRLEVNPQLTSLSFSSDHYVEFPSKARSVCLVICTA